METASQSKQVDKTRADKWTQGVMELIQSTQKGKLHWKRLSEPSQIYGETYEAAFSGDMLTLKTQSILANSLEKHSYWLDQFTPKIGALNERTYPSLRVTSGNQVVTVFPDIAALRGLAETVQERVDKNDEAFLEAIHHAANKSLNNRLALRGEETRLSFEASNDTAN